MGWPLVLISFSCAIRLCPLQQLSVSQQQAVSRLCHNSRVFPPPARAACRGVFTQPAELLKVTTTVHHATHADPCSTAQAKAFNSRGQVACAVTSPLDLSTAPATPLKPRPITPPYLNLSIVCVYCIALFVNR